MGPEDIAKLITEDPDVMENLKSVDLGLSKKAQSRKRKRKLNQMKRRHDREREFDSSQYKVDKITGQPKSGQILYSDVDEPEGGISESNLKNITAITAAVMNLGNETSRLISRGWDRGEWVADAVRLNKRIYQKGWEQAHEIAKILPKYSRKTGEGCAFVNDLTMLKSEYQDAQEAAAGKQSSPIAFPKGEWWGRVWTSRGPRLEYLKIFMGEVTTRFFSIVELQRQKHEETCSDTECQALRHAEYLIHDLLCDGGVRLKTIYHHFNRARAIAIRGKKKKSDELTGPRRYAKSNPLHARLMKFQKALQDQFKLEFTSSGMPRIPIVVPRDLDLRDYARKYLELAHAYFGDQVNIDQLWRESR